MVVTSCCIVREIETSSPRLSRFSCLFLLQARDVIQRILRQPQLVVPRDRRGRRAQIDNLRRLRFISVSATDAVLIRELALKEKR